MGGGSGVTVGTGVGATVGNGTVVDVGGGVELEQAAITKTKIAANTVPRFTVRTFAIHRYDTGGPRQLWGRERMVHPRYRRHSELQRRNRGGASWASREGSRKYRAPRAGRS